MLIIDFKDAEYKDSYSIGETIYIKKIEAYDDNEPILVYAQLQKSLDVIKIFNFSKGDESFVLTQECDYTLVYIAKDTYNKYHTKSYEFSVGNFDFFDISASRISVKIRHHNIQNDTVKIMFFNHVNGLFTVTGFVNFISIQFTVFFDDFSDFNFIVGN